MTTQTQSPEINPLIFYAYIVCMRRLFLLFTVHANYICVRNEGVCFQAPSLFVCFVSFVALRPKSTAMVMAGRSVHLTTLFPGQA